MKKKNVKWNSQAAGGHTAEDQKQNTKSQFVNKPSMINSHEVLQWRLIKTVEIGCEEKRAGGIGLNNVVPLK